MVERINFSTKDLTFQSVTNQHSFDNFSGERVWFSKNNWGDVRLAREGNSSVLRWVDNRIICLDPGFSFYYDHNYWVQPFGMGFQPKELAGSYPAVISAESATEAEDGRIVGAIQYGTFWYNPEGALTAIRCGGLTRGGFEMNNPFLDLVRLDQSVWQIYRLEDVTQYTYEYFLKHKEKLPEEVLLKDGKDIIFDELITNITDDGKVVTLTQSTITGHKQKVIQVPSHIDILKWRETLGKLEGAWVQVLKDFPTQIELVV
ncbi:hypothetical protein HYU45_04845 [Candidatus Daviesbacteria bacterium]|nr:hypothetical protein [Candidatus Daviesbacteria bacterium]